MENDDDDLVDLSTYYEDDNVSFVTSTSNGEELANEASATFFVSPSGVPTIDRNVFRVDGTLGFAAGRIYELLGVTGAGKTQLCLASAVSSALWAPAEGQVLYICSKAGTVLPRLLEMLRSTISRRVVENGITIKEVERKRRRVDDRQSRIGSSLISTLPLAASRLASIINDSESIEKLLRFDVIKSVDIEANEIRKRIRIIHAFTADELLSTLAKIEAELHESRLGDTVYETGKERDGQRTGEEESTRVSPSSIMMVIVDGLSNSILSSVYRIEGRAQGLGMIAEIGQRLSYLAKHHDLPILVSNLSIADCSDFSDEGSLIDFVGEEIIDESVEAQMISKSSIFETPKQKNDEFSEMMEDFMEDETELTEFCTDFVAIERVHREDFELNVLTSSMNEDISLLNDDLDLDPLEQDDIDELVDQECDEEDLVEENEDPFFFRLLINYPEKTMTKRLNTPGPRVSLSMSWRIVPEISLQIYHLPRLDETAENNDEIERGYIPGQPPHVSRLISNVTRKMTTRATIDQPFVSTEFEIPTLLSQCPLE
jgi:hypothetical protein